jgi:hypothetical protein
MPPTQTGDRPSLAPADELGEGSKPQQKGSDLMKRAIIGSLAVLTVFAFASQAVAAGKGKAIGKTKVCRATVAYVLEGPAVTVGSDLATLTVESANKHGSWLVGQDVTVTGIAATKISRDDEEATIADLVPEDTLSVMIRGCKDADPATLALVAHHIDAVSSAPAEEELPAEDL